MNQRQPQNISYLSIDVSLMVEKVTQNKNGPMISATVCVKSQ